MKPDDNEEDYINPLVNQMIEVVEQNPEIPEVVQQYLQDKEIQGQTEQREQEIDQATMTGTAVADTLIGAAA